MGEILSVVFLHLVSWRVMSGMYGTKFRLDLSS